MSDKTSTNQNATKMDIHKLERNLCSEILRTEEKLEIVDTKLDKKFGDVLTKLDGIVKSLEDLRTDSVVGAH